jgi:hypothetical protein
MSSERAAVPASRVDSAEDSASGRTVHSGETQATSATASHQDNQHAANRQSVGQTPAGRNRITRKALTQIVTAVSASALGVAFKSVSIGLNDDEGALAIAVSSPIRIPSLREVTGDAAAVERSGGTILARAAAAQVQIRDRVTELTGSSVTTVTVRLTGADITAPKRRVA